jgi:hypothetical protein
MENSSTLTSSKSLNTSSFYFSSSYIATMPLEIVNKNKKYFFEKIDNRYQQISIETDFVLEGYICIKKEIIF